jgi:hypothetical protein
MFPDISAVERPYLENIPELEFLTSQTRHISPTNKNILQLEILTNYM